MKKISIISIVGVLLTGVCGDVMAASSLSASTNSAKVSMPRAASLRFGGARSASMGKVIAPKADVKTIAPKTAGTTAGRAASVSRTSVGRYIGANKEQSVSMAALPDPLFERIGAVEERVDTAETNITDLQDNKQDKLVDSEDGFIRVVDDTHITIDIPTLSDALPSQSQPNWDEADSTAPGYIQNKPENLTDFNNDAGFITASDIPTQVQSDWNEADENSAAFIANKPAIPTVPTNVSAFINDAGYITSADVPSLPTNVSQLNNDAGYITASGIPTNVSAFINDANYVTQSELTTIQNAASNAAAEASDAVADANNALTLANSAVTLANSAVTNSQAAASSAQSAASSVSTFESRIQALESQYQALESQYTALEVRVMALETNP
ncbi:MAG: hypothetical protein IJR92_02500 [Alphaproteobacteria bacterium]|nr:hypothetical protein [Alphaproteobacteria bacterium]